MNPFATLTLAEIAVFIVLCDFYPSSANLLLVKAFAQIHWSITPDCISDTVQALVERNLVVEERSSNDETRYKRQPLAFYRQEQQDGILAIHECTYLGEHYRIYHRFPINRPPKKETHPPVAQDIPKILALKDENCCPFAISDALNLNLGLVRLIVRNQYRINADGSVSVGSQFNAGV